MTTLDDLRKELLRDPEVKTEYDALEPEHAIVRAMIAARTETGLT